MRPAHFLFIFLDYLGCKITWIDIFNTGSKWEIQDGRQNDIVITPLLLNTEQQNWRLDPGSRYIFQGQRILFWYFNWHITGSIEIQNGFQDGHQISVQIWSFLWTVLLLILISIQMKPQSWTIMLDMLSVLTFKVNSIHY